MLIFHCGKTGIAKFISRNLKETASTMLQLLLITNRGVSHRAQSMDEFTLCPALCYRGVRSAITPCGRPFAANNFRNLYLQFGREHVRGSRI